MSIAPLAPVPSAQREDITVILTLTLPPGSTPHDAARFTETLRAHAHALGAASTARAVRAVDPIRRRDAHLAASPTTNRRVTALAPSSATQPRRTGVVSPNAPARRDLAILRARTQSATAVSPSFTGSDLAPGLSIDLHGRRVRLDGNDIDFTYKEFELLAYLARNARRVVERTELMNTVWAQNQGETGERTVDVHVRRVRNKLGRYRRLISTARGSGYRLDPGSDVHIFG
ncbi:winged helix-turn-helix domain-containing protein [Devriesea agamarum]|uniref:winged helix-turn-helix domain-containing protein n=1 Tax=Devriesea agamarum TaxID=472569 RepID=UPI00071DBF6F|nr:winged helix-turn-helix domain-containing protein [Devriesea agamarum]